MDEMPDTSHTHVIYALLLEPTSAVLISVIVHTDPIFKNAVFCSITKTMEKAQKLITTNCKTHTQQNPSELVHINLFGASKEMIKIQTFWDIMPCRLVTSS